MNSDAKKVLELLKQEEMIENSLANGYGQWTVIYDSYFKNGVSCRRYAVFAQPDQRKAILSHSEWDFELADADPGFSEENQKGERVYRRCKEESVFEPIVTLQSFGGVEPDKWVLSESLCLLMNLSQDRESGDYYAIEDDGPLGPVVQFDGEKVEVLTSILRRYQAARQLDLVLFTSSDVRVQYISDKPVNSLKRQDLSYIKLEYSHILDGEFKSYSQLEMKHIIPPLPQKESGIGPWKKRPEEYPEFIFGKDENGNPVEYTCNPAKLYKGIIGANSHAPFGDTPVFFRKEVLEKYTGSRFYTIEDGYLCYGDRRVPFRYSRQGNIIVHLGDIHYIPPKDWLHWKLNNILPDS